MTLVAAGPFLMGSTATQIDRVHQSYGGERSLYEPEYPQRSVHLPAFWIDRTEVTQSQYKAFVDATDRAPSVVDYDWAKAFNWDSEQGPPAGIEQHPVVLVSFDDALEYCEWAGKALPSEAEWEKAARGPDGREYPWGEGWDSSRLNSAAEWADTELPTIDLWKQWWETVYKGQLRGKVITTKPVGSYPSGASPYGAHDMAGNVFEWVDAWFEPYPGSTSRHPEFGQTYRVVRGGDWYLDRIYARAAARLRAPVDHKAPTIGFRCVWRPDVQP